MKKKVVRSFVLLLIAGLAASCQFTGRHQPVDIDQVMQEYLDGKVIVSVEDAYELYDQDTSGVVFLDVRDGLSFREAHEPGAINLPANRLQEANIRELKDMNGTRFLVYSDAFDLSLDAWFALKWKHLPDVRIIRGAFDEGLGMMVDVSPKPSIDYAAVVANAKERLTIKPPPPPPPAPKVKRQVQVKKKPAAEEEEEGC